VDVFDLRNRLVDDYANYTRSFITIAEPRIKTYVEQQLQQGVLWPEPLLQLNPSFFPGGTIDDWVADGTLHPECARIFRINKTDVEVTGQPLQLHTGRGAEVARFFRAVLQTAQVPLSEKADAGTVQISLETPRALREALGRDEPFSGRFELPLAEGEVYLGRTSPMIEGLAGWTLDQALDPAARDPRAPRPVAARCGVIRTAAVQTRVTLLLARFRFHLRAAGAAGETLLCEEIAPLAATGSAAAPHWWSGEDSERLLAALPDSNLGQTLIDQQLALLSAALPAWQTALEAVSGEWAGVQREAHERVRQAAKTAGRVAIEPVLPLDILGAYLPLPVIRG